MANRAFAFSEGGAIPDGFSDNGDLIWETSQGSAAVSLAPDGPEGYVYWGGPDETTYPYIVAYASNAVNHTGANSVNSKVQFWGAVSDGKMIDLGDYLSTLGYSGLDPDSFGSADEAANAIDAAPDFHVIRP